MKPLRNGNTLMEKSTIKMILLPKEFYQRDAIIVAKELVGKIIIRKYDTEELSYYRITETEAYKGEDDEACHAHKGKTKRTEIMYGEGGLIYIYLIYGIHWMLNIVTHSVDNPQAVLIRCTENYNGPGKLTKALKIDKSFNGEKIHDNLKLYIADDGYIPYILPKKRIGIEYAGLVWKNKLWRFTDNRIEKKTTRL